MHMSMKVQYRIVISIVMCCSCCYKKEEILLLLETGKVKPMVEEMITEVETALLVAQ